MMFEHFFMNLDIVITSYSIHYTKLYDITGIIKVTNPSGEVTQPDVGKILSFMAKTYISIGPTTKDGTEIPITAKPIPV